jgi:Zn-finger nucleic acid-binding protein
MESLGGYRKEYDEYERHRHYDDNHKPGYHYDDYKKHHKKRSVFDILGDIFD